MKCLACFALWHDTGECFTSYRECDTKIVHVSPHQINFRRRPLLIALDTPHKVKSPWNPCAIPRKLTLFGKHTWREGRKNNQQKGEHARSGRARTLAPRGQAVDTKIRHAASQEIPERTDILGAIIKSFHDGRVACDGGWNSRPNTKRASWVSGAHGVCGGADPIHVLVGWIMPQWVQMMARLMFCDTSLISSPTFIWMRPRQRGCCWSTLNFPWVDLHTACCSPGFALAHSVSHKSTHPEHYCVCVSLLCFCWEILRAVLWSADSALVASKLRLNALGQISRWKICFSKRT